MGWWFQHKDEKQSLKDFFSKEFGTGIERNGNICQILDIALVNFTEVYMAYERHDLKTNEKTVHAIICLVKFVKNDEMNFGYKDMDESMHPFYYNCPERILKILSPTTNESELSWRKECYKVINNRRKAAKLIDGMIVEFETELNWDRGIGSAKVFTVTTYNKKSTGFMMYWGGQKHGGLLRITNLKDRTFVEIPPNRFVRGRMDKFNINDVQSKANHDLVTAVSVLDKANLRDKSLEKLMALEKVNGQGEYFLRLVQGQVEGFVIPSHLSFVTLTPILGQFYDAYIPMVDSQGNQLTEGERYHNIMELFDKAMLEIANPMITIDMFQEDYEATVVRFAIHYDI